MNHAQIELRSPLPCPFCGADVMSLYEGPPAPDDIGQCLSCLAAVLLTAAPDDPGHPARLKTALLEFLPPGDNACELALRRLPDAGRWRAAGSEGPLTLLAAWNLEEMIAPALAARILGIERAELDDRLAAGAFPHAVPGPEPRNRLEKRRWLIPRADLLPGLGDLGNSQ